MFFLLNGDVIYFSYWIEFSCTFFSLDVHISHIFSYWMEFSYIGCKQFRDDGYHGSVMELATVQ